MPFCCTTLCRPLMTMMMTIIIRLLTYLLTYLLNKTEVIWLGSRNLAPSYLRRPTQIVRSKSARLRYSRPLLFAISASVKTANCPRRTMWLKWPLPVDHHHLRRLRAPHPTACLSANKYRLGWCWHSSSSFYHHLFAQNSYSQQLTICLCSRVRQKGTECSSNCPKRYSTVQSCDACRPTVHLHNYVWNSLPDQAHSNSR